MDNYNYTACMWIYYNYTAFACMWIITVILLLLICDNTVYLYVDNYSYTAFACMWIITVILLLLVCG